MEYAIIVGVLSGVFVFILTVFGARLFLPWLEAFKAVLF